MHTITIAIATTMFSALLVLTILSFSRVLEDLICDLCTLDGVVMVPCVLGFWVSGVCGSSYGGDLGLWGSGLWSSGMERGFSSF